MRPTLILPVFLGILLGFAAENASYFYTKKRQTELLDSPRSRETPVARLPFREKLTLLERDGSWLKVSASNATATGWVYEGNVAGNEPPRERHLDFPSSASDTSVSIAARPLGEVAKNYAAMKGKQESAADVEWLEKLSDSLPPAAVLEYLQAEKKGEFQ